MTGSTSGDRLLWGVFFSIAHFCTTIGIFFSSLRQTEIALFHFCSLQGGQRGQIRNCSDATKMANMPATLWGLPPPPPPARSAPKVSAGAQGAHDDLMDVRKKANESLNPSLRPPSRPDTSRGFGREEEHQNEEPEWRQKKSPICNLRHATFSLNSLPRGDMEMLDLSELEPIHLFREFQAWNWSQFWDNFFQSQFNFGKFFCKRAHLPWDLQRAKNSTLIPKR